jgi:hypothetical protein
MITRQLSNSLKDYASFLPFIQAYSVWSRQRTGTPAHYKCFLSKSALDAKERELQHALPILTDEEAEIIDAAAASVTYQSKTKHKLFEILILSGWDRVDVYFSIPYVKKLMKQQGERFTVPMLEAKKKDLIEAVRSKLIEIEDTEYLQGIMRNENSNINRQ